MEGDEIINQIEAEDIHQHAIDHGLLTLWTVAWNPSDYPRKATARPHCIGNGTHHMLRCLLVANSLEELRAKLPRQADQRLEREPDDDPAIIEVWL